MTVGELIDILEQFPKDQLVVDGCHMVIEDVVEKDVYLCDSARPDAETTRAVVID